MHPFAPIAYCYAGALVAGGIVLFTGLLPISSPLFILTAALGLLPLGVLMYWAFQLEDQYNWLIKGHAKERATEVVTPPKQIRKFLHDLEVDLAHAGLMLMAYERTWQRRAFIGQWYGLFVASITAASVLTSLFFAPYAPAIILPHLPQSTPQILGMLMVALGFAVAIYAACVLLIKAADQNAAKLAKYLEQKTGQKIHISPLHPTALLPALGIFAVLLLAPITLLTSSFEAQKTVQQQAISQTKEVAKTLEKRLDDTLEKKDYFATENAALLDKNQKLGSNLKKAKDTEKLLRTEIDTLKDQLKQLTAKQAETQTKLTTTETEATAIAAKLAEQTKASKEQGVEAQKLKAKLAETEKTITLKIAEAEAFSQKTTSLQNKIQTLEAHVQQLEDAARLAPAPVVLNIANEMLPETAELSADKHSITMPADAFFAPQTNNETTYFINNIKSLWNILHAKVTKSDGYALKIYVYADALPPIAHSDNLALTAAQGAKLATAFIAEGAAPSKIMVIPLGNTYEIDSRLAPEALAKNRRIQFMIAPTNLP